MATLPLSNTFDPGPLTNSNVRTREVMRRAVMPPTTAYATLAEDPAEHILETHTETINEAEVKYHVSDSSLIWNNDLNWNTSISGNVDLTCDSGSTLTFNTATEPPQWMKVRFNEWVESTGGQPYNGQTYVTSTGTASPDLRISDSAYNATTGSYSITFKGNYVVDPVATTTVWIDGEQCTQFEVKRDPKKAIAEVIKSNLQIMIRRRRDHLGSIVSPAELKARDTLRDMITEKEYRRYLTNGFVMVPGASGKWYQIFSNHRKMVKVYEKGKCIHDLCIHTDDVCPPTDHVIGVKVLIEIDEPALWREANKRVPYSNDFSVLNENKKQESLAEIYKRLAA